MQDVRVFYSKIGRIKYISHLDINRAMQRLLRLSGLPVWYTEGFNPHIYITFALPLSLGYESECEIMDFRLTGPVEPEEILYRINRAAPEGLCCYKAGAPQMKPSAIAWCDYAVTLGCGQPREVAEGFRLYCARESIPVIKRSKKGEQTLDIRPHLQLLECGAGEEEVLLSLRLAAGNTMNINPGLLTGGFLAETGLAVDHMRVVRKAVYDGEMQIFA